MKAHPDGELLKLRDVNAQAVIHEGRPFLLLGDPLQLSDTNVLVPQQLAPLLALMDGEKDAGGLRAALMVRYGLPVSKDLVQRVVDLCDQALLLDNERFRDAHAAAVEVYRNAPCRPPALAGLSYPGDGSELKSLLDEYVQRADGLGPHLTAGRGLVSPHIDYERGWPVYAAVWKRAAEMVAGADLAIILGTDHHGGPGTITLTRQHYATPRGILPTSTRVVDALAGALGPDVAYAGELRHRTEHSIELAAAWLQHFRPANRPCEIVPILCGSFAHFVQGDADPESDTSLRALLNTLREATAGRRVVVVAAADMAHVGPAFDGSPLGKTEQARLEAADDELLARVCEGDAPGFFEAVKRVEDRNNVCGLAPIYLALRMLAPARGHRVAYEQCPADDDHASFVSISGVVFE